mgnify:FL=1
MMENLSPNEIVYLNPPASAKIRDITVGLLTPLYAVAPGGIYIIKRAQFMVKEGYKHHLYLIMTTISLLFTLAGIIAIINTPSVGAFIVWLTFLVWFIYSVKKLREVMRRKNEKIVPAELVAPWSIVKSISVMNVRDMNIGSILSPQFTTVGEWHVFTTDGREIVIENVVDPYNKLEYVKNKFGLKF